MAFQQAGLFDWRTMHPQHHPEELRGWSKAKRADAPRRCWSWSSWPTSRPIAPGTMAACSSGVAIAPALAGGILLMDEPSVRWTR